MQADTHTLFEHPLGKPLEAMFLQELLETLGRDICWSCSTHFRALLRQDVQRAKVIITTPEAVFGNLSAALHKNDCR